MKVNILFGKSVKVTQGQSMSIFVGSRSPSGPGEKRGKGDFEWPHIPFMEAWWCSVWCARLLIVLLNIQNQKVSA